VRERDDSFWARVHFYGSRRYKVHLGATHLVIEVAARDRE
jgi:hypothetical protein